MTEVDDPVILVRINQLYRPHMSATELFEATRGVWKVGPRRDKARYVLAVYAGEVVEAYAIEAWQLAGTADYSTRPAADVEVPGRWEFRGRVADASVRWKYVGRSVRHYLAKGSQNPIRYVNC